MKLKFCQISLFFMMACLISCSEPKRENYTYHVDNFWYKLLAFKTETCESDLSKPFIHINAVFKTQSDSVFYDTFNNLNNQFYLNLNGLDSSNFLSKACFGKCVGDSLELLIPKANFFEQNFNLTQIPFFSVNDSVVKVQMSIIGYMDKILKHSNAEMANQEINRIRHFFKTDQLMSMSKSNDGFFWVSKPLMKPNPEKSDSVLTVQYKGYFLNGRQMDESPSDFKYKPGTPDQLLKGLNIVINYLKRGENAKIILPSHLAFGELGSKDLKIPSYTPLLYEITIK